MVNLTVSAFLQVNLRRAIHSGLTRSNRGDFASSRPAQITFQLTATWAVTFSNFVTIHKREADDHGSYIILGGLTAPMWDGLPLSQKQDV
jgi:hypothetical protein